jgi:uncharacterized protein YjbJ (UPF0337 family)
LITIYKPTTLDGRYSINTNAFYQATGAAQSALGSLTGSQADKVNDPPRLTHYSRQSLTTTNQNQAEQKKAEAEARKDSWNQTVGAGKEALGGALGLEGMRKAGEQQNAEGKGQEAQGQLSDLGKGVSDRVSGTVGGAFAGLTGDEAEKKKRELQHDQGKTLQRGVESEVGKKAE